LGFTDEWIGLGMHGSTQASFLDSDRDEKLSAWLDSHQQTTIGGPKAMTQFERAQIEAAVHAIWDMQGEAHGEYQQAVADTDMPGPYGPVGPGTNTQYEYVDGEWRIKGAIKSSAHAGGGYIK